MTLRSSRATLAILVLTLGGAAAAACGSSGTTMTTGSTGPTGTGGNASGTGMGGSGGMLFNTVASTSTGDTSSSGVTGSTGTGTMANCDPAPTTGPHTWSKIYGDPSSQFGLAVTHDATGNVIIAGAFSGSVVFGVNTLTSAGASDIFVAKFAPDGAPIWAKSFGDGKDQSARGIAADAQGNVVVVGQFVGSVNFGGSTFTSVGPNFDDAFIVKLGPQGNHIWSKKFGDINSQVPHGVAVSAAGDIAMVGDFQTNMTFDAIAIDSTGDTDAFVAVFDAAGNAKWAKAFGDIAAQSAHAVAFDATGNVLVTGDTAGAIDFGAGALPLAGTNDAWAAKLSGAGAVTWGKLYGAGKSSGEGVGADATGNIYLAGDHAGKIDFGGGALDNSFGPNVYVAKLDPLGKEIWSHTYGDSMSQHAKGLSVDGKGHAIVVGSFTGAIDFGKGKLPNGGGVDGFVAKLDTQGCGIWQKSFGDASFQSASGVSADAMGNVLITGSITGTADFGGGPLAASGDDVFVAKLAP
ncbi:MAG: hypothetical protein ABJE95_34745 [Byssovorax sp.]